VTSQRAGRLALWGPGFRAVPPADVFGQFTLGLLLVLAAAVAAALRSRSVEGTLAAT
jgi:hypothetical protein